MVDELASAANVDQLAEADLRDDSAQLTRGSRDTVRGRAVASGERLTRDDEGRRVGAEVLEEVREAVEGHEGRLSAGPAVVHHRVVAEACGRTGENRRASGRRGRTHDDEEDGEYQEAHELDRLAAPAVDEEERGPVAGDEPGYGEDEVPEADIGKILEHGSRAREIRCGGSETDGGEDDGRVQAQAIKRDLGSNVSAESAVLRPR